MYICIDLKSFYASVECADRGLDPLDTNLVVADVTKTSKTICLAVTPSLKAHGISGRARLFEVEQQLADVNRKRAEKLPYRRFSGASHFDSELKADPSLKIDFIAAPPRMALYEKISSQIYDIYLRYVAPEDVLVYSIDEVFIDVSAYLGTYHMTAHELAMTMIRDVLRETRITATAGIGTNMYLAKIAMDILAKKMPPDKDGVRIAELDEMSYRDKLWEHTPITDFWRVGRGIAKKLAANHLYTMGDIAEISEQNEDLLYKLFGVNAELLIDHAWGWEPVTIADVRAYVPESRSISQGQVLSHAYNYEGAELIIREMTELLVLELVKKELVCDQIVLTIGYDHEGIPSTYKGPFVTDIYGRRLPKQSHGSMRLGCFTSSTKLITEKMMQLFAKITNSELMVRRMYVVAEHICREGSIKEEYVQFDFFTDPEELAEKRRRAEEASAKERSLQKAMLGIKERFGKNAILKGMNLREGATTIERNAQIGGHRA